MKKWLSILICLCMVMALAVGCSSDTGEGSNSGSTSSDTTSSDGGEASEEAPSGETSTLTITYIDTNNLGEAATYYTWINDVYENWDKKDQVELDIQPVVAPDSDYFTRIQLQMSDASTSPDIVYDDSFQIAADVGAGYLSNLDDYLAGWELWSSGAFVEALKAGVTGDDGSIYAIPAGTDGRGLWYNRQVMVDAGVIANKDEEWVPETWDDVLDAARAIKENCEGVTPFFAQVANANAESTSMNTYEMIYYGTGEELYDKTSGLWTIRSQGILDSLTFLQTMYTEELSYDLGTSLDVNSANTAIEDLSTYELGIFLCGTWIASNYLDTGMFPWAEFQDELNLAPMPTQNGDNGGLITMSGGWAWAIPENSDNKDLAFEFMTQLYEDTEAYTNWCIGNGQIAVMDLSDQASYMEQPFMDKISPLFDQAVFRPFSERYSSVSSYISAMVEEVVTGGDVNTAMENFATGVISVVGEEATQDLLN